MKKSLLSIILLACAYTIFAQVADTTVEHEYVDLGLPSGTKWATTNIGANAPEEPGDFFAWGEICAKHHFTIDGYKFRDKNSLTTKYTTRKWTNAPVDNKTTLEAEDDVATTSWGKAWRMPTSAELNELRQKCTWQWTTHNNIEGCVVTGPNGNSIFLPAAGIDERKEGSGNYWSSSLNADDDGTAYCLVFNRIEPVDRRYHRFNGLSVRAVRAE